MRKSIIFISAAVFLTLVCTASAAGKKNGNEKNNNEKKNYLGWVDSSAKDVTHTKGIIQMRIKPNLGSFNIGVVNKNDKTIPVISTINEFTSSAFYLKTSKKVYKLANDTNIKASVNKDGEALELSYAVANVAEVKLNFDFIQSLPDNDFDVVKVKAQITNQSNKKDDFSLKCVLDTVLGETGSYHFYTADNKPVKNEVLYRNPIEEKWFVSRNNLAAMQIFFNGGDTTAPEVVALANYSTLDKNSWEPDMLSFRTFDTVLSYNNSAVGVIWPSVKLQAKASKDIIFYLAFATDGDEPAGHYYVYDIEPEEEPEVEPVPLPAALQVKAEPKMAKEPEPAKKKLRLKEEEKNYNPKEIPDVDFNVENLSKEQYTPEYIQDLLNRISLLEQDSSSVNREELLQLNAELDAILSALKQ